MQTTALARVLAVHRASQRPAARLDSAAPDAPAKPHPLLLAIARNARLEPRTLLEMARDRNGVRRPWQ
ncbi:MAG TPA: hypothetical protein VFN42_03295 [Acetobacteraceae bacterium]|nr:hypothetical protein [Acetobacteraceae bacterium]